MCFRRRVCPEAAPFAVLSGNSTDALSVRSILSIVQVPNVGRLFAPLSAHVLHAGLLRSCTCARSDVARASLVGYSVDTCRHVRCDCRACCCSSTRRTLSWGRRGDGMSEGMRGALNAILFRTGDQSRDFSVVLATNRPGAQPSAGSQAMRAEHPQPLRRHAGSCYSAR